MNIEGINTNVEIVDDTADQYSEDKKVELTAKELEAIVNSEVNDIMAEQKANEDYLSRLSGERSEEDRRLLDVVLSQLNWSFVRYMLVKPLDDVMVDKTITTPVETDQRDEHGVLKFETKEETKTVPANFKRGIVLAVPASYEWPNGFEPPRAGDTIAYSRKGLVTFDLFKSAELVNPYEMVAIIRA